MALQNNKCFMGRNNPYNTEKHKKVKKKKDFLERETDVYFQEAEKHRDAILSFMKKLEQDRKIQELTFNLKFFHFFNNISKFNSPEEALVEYERLLREYAGERKIIFYVQLDDDLFEKFVEEIMTEAKELITELLNT